MQFAQKAHPIPGSEKRLSVKSSPEEWANLIDATWGQGPGRRAKLLVFDRFWSTIDQYFACFQGVEVDWSGLRAQYRPEVENGVSRGRFAAIMSRLSLSLMDARTKASDKRVEWHTRSGPGVPLLHVGGWGLDTHFGAGLTPLPNKSLLVYKTVPAHPLGLEPGDIVIGYDGQPWSELYPQLLALGLPVTGLWGSSPSTYEHSWLMAAGLNWHLFDAIDVKKFESGEVLHLPVSPMIGVIEGRWVPEADPFEGLWNTEQLEVDGVPFPDFVNGHLVSWGIVEGSRIGYIYVWGWFWDAEQEFYEAVHNLMYDHETEGLIIDLRFNMGGNMLLSDLGLGLLFDQTVQTIDFGERYQQNRQLSLCAKGQSEAYLIPGNPDSFYDKPIAVLTGPGAVGAGEQVALRLKFHPNVRFFGMSTNTAMNAPAAVKLRKNWDVHFAQADAFLLSETSGDPPSDDPPPFDYQSGIHNTWREGIAPTCNTVVNGQSLTHHPFPVDQQVWLTAEDVAAGRDTVVEAAKEWITLTHE
jgi:hypothetical protein